MEFLSDIFNIFCESNGYDVGQKVSLLIKTVVIVFLFQVVSLIVQGFHQYRLKQLEKRNDIDKIKAENKIEIYEEIYKKSNNVHKALRGDVNYMQINIDNIVAIRAYMDENKLYLDKKFLKLCNNILDMLLLKVTLSSDYNENEYLKLVEAFKKDFGKV